MKLFKVYISIIVIGVTFSFCSKINDELTVSPEINVHNSGINTPGNNNFHSSLLVDKSLNDCKQCHDNNFSGGTAGVSCATSDCHPSIAVHQPDILNSASNDFHPKKMKSADFELENCSQCHGDNFNGGIVAPSCVSCHNGLSIHLDGFGDTQSSNFHGKKLNSINWDLSQCAQCHDSDYSGGIIAPSCKTCHTQDEGPEACNTCHGDFNDPTKIAPPDGITRDNGLNLVGAHDKHLNADITINIACAECHIVPTLVSDTGHLDGDLRAEITYGQIRGTAQFGIPTYTSTSNSGTCANIYCHGSFRNGNNDNIVDWVNGDAKCGSCHGDPVTENPLPSGTHTTSTGCEFCHADVVSRVNNELVFIDSTKHVNGKINVFGNEIDF